MSYFEAVILGLVQGLAEFLPISSSGHLALLQQAFGVSEDKVLLFAVLCIPALHGLFDISNALTGSDILKIVGFAFLPTLLIQLFRAVRGK